MNTARELAQLANELLRCRETPDYPLALNGLQVDNRAPVTQSPPPSIVRSARFAVPSTRGANLLVVHHGLFWGGLAAPDGVRTSSACGCCWSTISRSTPRTSPSMRTRPSGNSALLARELGLAPAGGFARYQTVFCGVQGNGRPCDHRSGHGL